MKQNNKCSKCGKILRQDNKTKLCSYHYRNLKSKEKSSIGVK